MSESVEAGQVLSDAQLRALSQTQANQNSIAAQLQPEQATRYGAMIEDILKSSAVAAHPAT